MWPHSSIRKARRLHSSHENVQIGLLFWSLPKKESLACFLCVRSCSYFPFILHKIVLHVTVFLFFFNFFLKLKFLNMFYNSLADVHTIWHHIEIVLKNRTICRKICSVCLFCERGRWSHSSATFGDMLLNQFVFVWVTFFHPWNIYNI